MFLTKQKTTTTLLPATNLLSSTAIHSHRFQLVVPLNDSHRLLKTLIKFTPIIFRAMLIICHAISPTSISCHHFQCDLIDFRAPSPHANIRTLLFTSLRFLQVGSNKFSHQLYSILVDGWSAFFNLFSFIPCSGQQNNSVCFSPISELIC